MLIYTAINVPMGKFDELRALRQERVSYLLTAKVTDQHGFYVNEPKIQQQFAVL